MRKGGCRGGRGMVAACSLQLVALWLMWRCCLLAKMLADGGDEAGDVVLTRFYVGAEAVLL